MQIETTKGTQSVASAGVGGAALGLGIAGTIGLLNQFANGVGFGGLGNSSMSALANGANEVIATTDTREIGDLKAQIAALESQRYTDNVGIEIYKEAMTRSNANDKEINAKFTDLAAQLASLDKQVAVERQQTVDNFAFLNNKIDTTKSDLEAQILNGDTKLYEYVNATFVPGKLVMPLSSICPEAMQRYNSWTAPTTPTTAS